jgi:dihydrofolate reductase
MSLTERADILLYGRTVWGIMSSYWPNAGSMSQDEHAIAFAPVWRSTPKVVLSTTLDSADYGTRIVRTVEEIKAIKEEAGKDILLTGSASVAAALAERDLVDEYHVVVHPVVLGGGKPVHQGLDRRNFRLADSRVFDGRTVLLRHDLV